MSSVERFSDQYMHYRRKATFEEVEVNQVCPHCGCELGRSRSGQDHRRLFGLIRQAFMHWPEASPFKPASEEHLRAYLLVRIGHVDITSIPAPEGIEDEPLLLQLFRLSVEAAATALQRTYRHVDIRIGAGGAAIITPRSIDYRTVTQKEFGPVRDAIQEVIEAELGVSTEQLLKEKAA